MDLKENQKRIGIDARTLGVKGGSRTYVANLLKNFPSKKRVYLFGVSNFEDYNCVPSSLNQQNPLLRLMWENLILSFLLIKYKIDVFHGTKGVVPLFSTCKTVLTVHDLTMFQYPESLNFLDRIYWSKIAPFYIRRANHIIAVSHSTKNDLIKFLQVNPDKISVVDEAYSRSLYQKKDRVLCEERLFSFFKSNPNPALVDFLSKKIILNVNTIQPRKNIETLIRTFNESAKVDKDVVLVIVGKKGWKYEGIFREYDRSPFKDRIYFLGYVPDEITSDLYNIAKIFVYPSFYEGFGLPILEAQACGCPVITSDCSSLPEVAGDAAILVDPHNERGLSEAIYRLINNEALRLELEFKGLENVKRFSWDRCAKETCDIYEIV